MRITVLGGDGYCGWATALYLSKKGHSVSIVDNFARRQWDHELGVQTLTPIRTLTERLRVWQAISPASTIDAFTGDITDYEFLASVIERACGPTPWSTSPSSAPRPYSMIDRKHAVFTQVNNVVGTLNLLFAIREHAPDAISSSSARWASTARRTSTSRKATSRSSTTAARDTLPYPKQPGSFYHLSKVHDSHNIMFACRIWGLRATDLNQGVVYGTMTDEVALDEALVNRFDYDEVFGTVLNRFCVEAAVGHPLTVYGKGGQTRGFIDIRDTVRCIELACLTPAAPGEFRVFNQFTEQFSVLELAGLVQAAAQQMGLDVHDPAPAGSAGREGRALLQREALEAARPRPAAALPVGVAARFAGEHRRALPRSDRHGTVHAAGGLAPHAQRQAAGRRSSRPKTDSRGFDTGRIGLVHGLGHGSVRLSEPAPDGA